MAYVKRDGDGRIVAVYAREAENGLEEIHETDPELGQFLSDCRMVRSALSQWIESDLSMARIVEDLIGVLIDKNVIRFDELPEDAQQKILRRRGLRRELAYVASLFGDDEQSVPDSERSDKRYL